MNKVLAVASVVIKEMYRRKDFYVLLILTVILTVGLGMVNFFNDPNIVRHLKEVCLLLIWICALVIAITTAARQIPAERENRTIFPLLAKPVSRGQVITGKFFGCWFAVGLALVMFYLVFAVISGSREHSWPIMNYIQTMALQWTLLAIVIAIVLFGSVLFTSTAENVTISFFLIGGMLLLGGQLDRVALQQAEPMRTLIYTVYYLIPHLEWFDVRDRIVYDWGVVPWGYCLLAMLYAAAYVAMILFATWLLFRRKALNV